MPLTITMTLEAEQALHEEASQRGVTTEEYARTLLEGNLPARSGGNTPLSAMDEAAFVAALDAFSEDSEGLPVLPPEADRREWIYGERD